MGIKYSSNRFVSFKSLDKPMKNVVINKKLFYITFSFSTQFNFQVSYYLVQILLLLNFIAKNKYYKTVHLWLTQYVIKSCACAKMKWLIHKPKLDLF